MGERHSRHESFVFFVCTDLSPHTREKKKLSRNRAEFGVRALTSVTNGLAAPALPSHVFYVETARCQTRRQSEKHGPDAHPRRHRRPREIYGVVCRVGRSGAATPNTGPLFCRSEAPTPREGCTPVFGIWWRGPVGAAAASWPKVETSAPRPPAAAQRHEMHRRPSIARLRQCPPTWGHWAPRRKFPQRPGR